MNKYAIVAIGLVDPLGFNRTNNWKKYINGDIAVQPITNFSLEEYSIIKIMSS